MHKFSVYSYLRLFKWAGTYTKRPAGQLINYSFVFSIMFWKKRLQHIDIRGRWSDNYFFKDDLVCALSYPLIPFHQPGGFPSTTTTAKLIRILLTRNIGIYPVTNHPNYLLNHQRKTRVAGTTLVFQPKLKQALFSTIFL